MDGRLFYNKIEVFLMKVEKKADREMIKACREATKGWLERMEAYQEELGLKIKTNKEKMEAKTEAHPERMKANQGELEANQENRDQLELI
jgi:hypothetical protein